MKRVAATSLMIVSLAFLIAVDSPASEVPRWGITTKKKIDEKQSGPAPGAVAEPDAAPGGTQQQNHAPDAPPPATPPSGSDEARKPPETGEPIPAAASGPTPPAVPPRPAAPPKAAPSKAADKAAAPKQQPDADKIAWANEDQKKVCETYLKDLQDHFIKARHYSIQGVPCNTAEHSSAFLRLSEKCRSDCPPGLLEQKGYTPRIVRNLSFLEKLGTERCVGTPAPKKAN